MHPTIKTFISFLGLLPFFCSPAIAIKHIPNTYEYINDEIHLLTLQQASFLSQKLFRLENHNGVRIVVLISSSLGDEDIKNYAQRVADAWLSDQDTQSGAVLFTMDAENGSVYISTNGAIGGALPDITVHKIIRTRLTPQWREKNWFEGINETVDAIIEAVSDEQTKPTHWVEVKPLNIRLWIELALLGIAVLYFLLQVIGIHKYLRRKRKT